jgi:transposase
MPGRFRGLTDQQWEVIGPLIPDPFTGYVGRPHAPFRAVVNTIVWILITGARWADVPEEEGFASKSTAHRWLGIWSEDGTLDTIKAYLLGDGQNAGLIDWERGSVDGSFVAGKGGGEGVEYGFKGKGLTLHSLTEKEGKPLSVISTGAAESERGQVISLLDTVQVHTGKPGRPNKVPHALQADKGYDSKELRQALRKRGIAPMISRRSWPDRKAPRGRPPAKPVDRWKAERTFSWLQRKFRRLVVRWERKNKYWEGFILFALCIFWVNLLIL